MGNNIIHFVYFSHFIHSFLFMIHSTIYVMTKNIIIFIIFCVFHKNADIDKYR